MKRADIPLRPAERTSRATAAPGARLGRGVPKRLRALATAGLGAMLWGGGPLLLVGADDLGWHAPYELVHHAEEAVGGAPAVGGLLAWLTNTFASALVGLIVGAVVVVVMHLVQKRRGAPAAH